jgi:hypothetical protein
MLHLHTSSYCSVDDPYIQEVIRHKRQDQQYHAVVTDVAGVGLRSDGSYRPVSILGLARARRLKREHDVLASNARLRRRLWEERDASPTSFADPGHRRSARGRACDGSAEGVVMDDDPLAASERSYMNWQRSQEAKVPQPSLSPQRDPSRSSDTGDPSGTSRQQRFKSGAKKINASSLRQTIPRAQSPLTHLPPTYHPKGDDPKGLLSIPVEHHNKLRVLEQLFESFELGQEREAHRAEEEHHRIMVKNMAAKRALTVEAAQLRLQFANKMKRKSEREAFPSLRRESSLRLAANAQNHL